MPQLPHSVKAGIYEVYAFDDMIIGEADNSSSRPIATGTHNNLERLFKTFRQHVDPKKDAEDAKDQLLKASQGHSGGVTVPLPWKLQVNNMRENVVTIF